jgi:hypothetical protein
MAAEIIDTYAEFVKNKRRVEVATGHQPVELNENLFDFQHAIVSWAVRRGRAAIFADTGLGKTLMQLAWADEVASHTGGIVVVLAPLAVSEQTIEQGRVFGIEVSRIPAGESPSKPGVWITNYERINAIDFNSLSGIVLDESSILKSHDGKTRTAIIESCQSIPYRLSCTATPSPNDFEELGNQCEFLGVMTRTEMLATYFINDAGDTGTWILKGWGQSRFWEWMGTWAVVLRSPADLGFDGSRYDLPTLTYHEHVVQTEALGDELFSRPALTMLERRKAQRNSIEARCKALADVVNSEPNEPWLIWCHLNDEADLLQQLIPGSINIQGSDSPEFKVCGSRWFLGDDSLQNDVFSDKLSATEKELLGWMTKKKLDALTCTNTTKRTKKNSGQNQEKSATNTTRQELQSTQTTQNGKKEQGPQQENGLLKIQKSGKVSESSNTELMAQSTTECYQLKEESAQSASLQMLETSAEDGSMLTTAIHPEKSEGFCVSHAITDLENSKIQLNHSKEQLDTLNPARAGRVLISKARIFGYGLNFQHCARMAFVGLDDSFEKFYQAVRRCYRFGQKREVKVHIFTAENEGQILQNIKRKEQLHHEMSANMIEHMKDIMNKELAGQENIVDEYQEATFKGDGFTVHMGDCVKWARKMADNSIDYSVFSPPFADLFTYSNSDHDMGNCANDDEFVAQMKFLIGELYRVIKPGRNVSFHCMNLPTTKMRQGFIGLRDFRGDLIRSFQEAGFIYHSEVCIWKDPVVAMQRTKALGLLHKTIRENSTMSRMGLPDYVVTMRKPGDIEERVTHGDDLPVMMWQKYASPIWDDINQSRTLNKMPARDDKDLKHMCPLQLDVIERCIHLWTNPGDLIFSPFTGIGSEGYCAVKMGRRFVGTELKPSYYELACQNISDARKNEQEGLFAQVLEAA